MTRWFRVLLSLGNPRMCSIAFLSFSSGLPFLLILSTLSAWLKDAGITNTQIGLMSLVTLPYAFKFVWAPLMDAKTIPLLTRLFGHRRSWLLVSQFCLFFSIIGLSLTNPNTNVGLTAFMALLVGVCSATQDIVIEAYRIEILPRAQYSIGAGMSVMGYRFGMLASGSGALYIAHYFSWQYSYLIMASLVAVGMVAALMSTEPEVTNQKWQFQHRVRGAKHPRAWLEQLLFYPLRDFVSRSDWRTIVLFILFFKSTDTLINHMSTPFLLEIGFSKAEIASVAKTFGIFAMIVGGLLGSFLLLRLSLTRSLMICCGLQILSSLLFMMQSVVGNDLGFLMFTVGIENLVCGMCQVALIAYLSHLCSTPYTATHYAILSSVSSLDRVGIAALSGWLADQMSWTNYYLFSGFFCLVALVLLLKKAMHFHHVSTEPTAPRPA